MAKVTKTDRQHSAGVLDTEGCVSIVTSGQPQIRPQITIGQKDPEILYIIREIIGMGSICKRASGTYVFCILGKENVAKFTYLVLPYSLVKKEQLELMLEFLKLIGPIGTNHITKENRRQRIILAKKIRQAKYRDFKLEPGQKVSPASTCGYWEGDGCLCCYREEKCYRPQIAIVQKFPNILKVIQSTLGFGRITQATTKSYRLRIENKVGVERFIRFIRPYVWTQKDKKRLDIGLQLLDLIGATHIKISKENTVQRKMLAEQITKLNHNEIVT